MSAAIDVPVVVVDVNMTLLVTCSSLSLAASLADCHLLTLKAVEYGPDKFTAGYRSHELTLVNLNKKQDASYNVYVVHAVVQVAVWVNNPTMDLPKARREGESFVREMVITDFVKIENVEVIYHHPGKYDER